MRRSRSAKNSVSKKVIKSCFNVSLFLFSWPSFQSANELPQNRMFEHADTLKSDDFRHLPFLFHFFFRSFFFFFYFIYFVCSILSVFSSFFLFFYFFFFFLFHFHSAFDKRITRNTMRNDKSRDVSSRTISEYVIGQMINGNYLLVIEPTSI